MKTIHVIRRKSGSQTGYLARQRGMGATMILFTIALIVLVGAALAYASRGNPSAINTQTAKVQAAVVLKQGADYRDAYNRYSFDGNSMTTIAFTNGTGDLFDPALQYGNLQAPPAQVMNVGAVAKWQFNKVIAVNGIGTAAGLDTIAYIADVTLNVCREINNQLYATGSTTVPPLSGLTLAAVTPTTAALDAATTTQATIAGRPTGCFMTADTTPPRYVVYTTLGEY